MNKTLIPLILVSTSCIQIEAGPVDHSHHVAKADIDIIEEIVVEGDQPSTANTFTVKPKPLSQPDSAALLKTLPGANVNSNGPITGIVQYRGLYSNRVAVSMENESVLSGGPNAMDPPLSYASPLLLKDLVMTQGIASVDESQESIGGHLRVNLDRGEFATSEEAKLSGALTSRYRSIDDGVNHAVKAVAANQSHKLSVLGAYDEGNDAETGDNKILRDTGYQRQRYDLGYAWQGTNNSGVEVSLGKLDTENSGTPALPMDIIYVDSDLANFNGVTQYNDLTLRARMGYRHVDHKMDNFSLRSNASPMAYRQNKATGQQFTWGANMELPIGNDTITLGVDSTEAQHSALITNPNMPMFRVKNFADVERNIHGLFAQWQGLRGLWEIESGLRYNHIKMDSDDVFANGMMPMMQMAANNLAANFNSANRDQSFDNIDVVFKALYPLNKTTKLNVGFGRKTRAPSYQELYLWLPLEATGGLADGRTYIGNLSLDSETSYEATLGFDWSEGDIYANGQVFFRRINDYIQGTPSTNMNANMLSTMMRGKPPLQFNNIEAELYGFDGRYGLTLNDDWRLDGVLSYVRGRDVDNSDNLYRIAPLNHHLTLRWQQASLSANLESALYARQHDTSSYNDEQETAGYGLLNLFGQYQPAPFLSISAGVENLLDKDYISHLNGYNRNADSDIPVGDRLPGNGRNFFVSVAMNW